MRLLYYINLCAFFAAVVSGVAIQNVAYGASERSPLQRPYRYLQRDLAKALKCTWGDNSYGEPQCFTEELPLNKLHVFWDHGKIYSIEFRPYLEDVPIYDTNDGSVRKTEPAAAQQHNVSEAIAALFPSWKSSRAWMQNAINRSREDGFQTSLRINNTSIYVRNAKRVAGQGPDFIFVVLTSDKDLHWFKENRCVDDAQGHADEHCGPDDGYILKDPRPPDNPILLLK